MAAVSRLQSLTNNISLQNLIHRHLLRPVAAATAAGSAHSFNISSESQSSVHLDFPNLKSSLSGHFSDKNKLSFKNVDEFLLNWKFPIGISALPAFDLSLMELRGSRSTSSKKRFDLEEDLEDDDEDDFDDDDDDDDGLNGFDDVDEDFSDSDDEDDDYGRRGGGGRGGGPRGGSAYTA